MKIHCKVFSFIPLVLIVCAAPLLSIDLRLVGERAIERAPEQVFSENEAYVGEILYDRGGVGHIQVRKFILKTAEGKILWEEMCPRYMTYSISNTGKRVVGYFLGDEMGKHGELGFYNEKGEIINRVEVRYFTRGFFSGAGEKFVAATGEGLLVFNANGKELLNLGKCRIFAVSKEGTQIVSIKDDMVTFFHREQLVGFYILSTPFSRGVDISPNGKYAGVMAAKYLGVFNMDDGEVVWEYRIPEESLKFFGIDVGDEVLAAVIGSYRAEKGGSGYVGLWNMDGKLLCQKELSWGNEMPWVTISSDGRFLRVRTRGKEWEFEIVVRE